VIVDECSLQHERLWPAVRRGKRHVATIEDAVPGYLTDEPARRSIKRCEMDPNPLGATWHLRLGTLWVYYDIEADEQTVWILRAGVKERNRVIIGGEEFDLRDLGEEGRAAE
jgi:hypothetical protein